MKNAVIRFKATPQVLLVIVLPLGTASSMAAQTPEAIYQQTCSVCHDGQIASAPRKGDTAAWAPRLAKGKDVLLENVLKGYSVMPPKGMCLSCTKDDLKGVIDWMAH
ncbi:c-type cytochrome [Pseudomonas benzopyrenica]